jgi:hypothetical protein
MTGSEASRILTAGRWTRCAGGCGSPTSTGRRNGPWNVGRRMTTDELGRVLGRYGGR